MKRRTLTKGLIIAVMIAMIAAAGLLAACGETTYTVRFDTGGGSLVDSQTVKECGTATEPEPPTRDGYTFAGWYTDSECTQEFSFSQLITSDITLYAKWVNNTYIPGGGGTPGGGDIPVSGETPGLEYTLNDEGTAYSVTGIGTATDTNIVIASEYNGLPVTSISDYAFEREMDITSVFVPGSVKTIGVSAFGDCYALRKVILNEGLISIAWYAFGAEDDGILSEVNLPSTLQEIGDAAFCGTALTQITIPKSVTVIDEYAFMESASLTIYCEEESKPEGWAQTWNEDEQPVVWGCKNNDIADDGNLYYVDENNLRYSLKEDGTAELVRQSEGLSVVENIPQKITYNGKGYDVTTIKSDAFEDSSVLSKIVIPSSITTIEGAAISSFISTVVYCETAAKPAGWDKNWTSKPIVWDYKNNDIADDGNLYVFQNDIRFVLNDGEAAVSGEQRKDIIDAVIPENIQYGTESYVVTRIDDFDDTYTLRSMSLPSTLEYVNLGLWHNSFGEVEKIYISDWGSFLNIEFDGYEISNPLYYSENVYVGGELCDGNVIIPSSVTAIKDYALCWSGLTSITIPDSVTSISERAFSGTKLIQKENGVSYVDKWVVDCDSSLTQVQLYDNTAGIADSAFGYCDLLTSIVIPDSVVSIGNSAFAECSALSSVTLGGGIISIGDNAFEDCIALTSISIPNSVTSIGEYAFSGCNGLTNITIPNSVTSIGEGAFFYNDSLTSITLDQGNANYYFAGNCLIETDSKTLIVGSESSVIPDDGSVTRIGNSAFSDCSGLTSIVIPDSVTSIGDYAFSSCDSLTSIVIPDSVTSIGDRAFSSCSSLTSIVIPDSVTSIGDSAFA